MRKLTIILLSGLICALGVTSALAQDSWGISEYEKATGKTIDSFSEAPMLRILVAAGDLPPVEERLPEDFLVVEPVEEIGQYGGTMRAFSLNDGGYDDGNIMRGYGTSMVVSPDLQSVIPHFLKDAVLSEDGKSATLYLRKGMKWSDGVPFTVDDLLFYWEDCVLNEELMPIPWDSYKPGGELWEVEKIDDYTVRYSFAAPQFTFVSHWLSQFAGGEGLFYLPKHYLKRYHASYTSMEELDKIVEREGFDSWVDLFNLKKGIIGWGSYWIDVETPTLRPWLLKRKGVNWWELERNPYFFAVDTAGNQLPYIDKILITSVGNLEVYNAKVVSGESDLSVFETSLTNYTLYVESAEAGDYRVLDWKSVNGSEVAYFVNQTIIGDPVLRKIFQDVRFRRALSVAIDREEINEALYYGLAVPRQFTVIPDSKYYEESFGTAYAQYDPAMANRLLDEMGLDKRDAQGYRLRPDGKRLNLLMHYSEHMAPFGPVSELVQEYWGNVGLEATLKLEAMTLQAIRRDASEIPIYVHAGGYTSDVDFPRTLIHFAATAASQINWGPLWGLWQATGGQEGEEPPEEVKKNIERWKKILISGSEEEIIRLAKEILQSQADNLWTIGTVGLSPKPVVVKNYMRNVPEEGVFEWGYMFLNNYRPEQFFFKE